MNTYGARDFESGLICAQEGVALADRPGDVPTRLAAAGYLALAGNPAEADTLFAKIPVPTAGSQAFADYASSAAWYHALKGDRAKVIYFIRQSLAAAEAHHVDLHILQYFRTEVDLDKFRNDPEFAELLKR